MKRFLLSLVAIVFTSVCFAQDIIVQKDGNTINAKIIKVTQSEVEYKKYNNQKGPTYTISTKDLQCINYQNGTKDTFVSPNYNPNIVTNESATQFSNDQALLNLYNQGKKPSDKQKKLKTIGYVAGGVLAAGGGVLIGAAGGDSGYVLMGAGLILAGAGTWAGFYYAAKRAGNRSQLSVYSSPVFQQEFNIGKNDRLMVGVDLLKDNTYKNQTLGLGVSYSF